MGSHSYEQCVPVWFSLNPLYCSPLTWLVKAIPSEVRWHIMASVSIVNSDVDHSLLVPIGHLYIFKKDFAHFQTEFFLAVQFFGLLTYFIRLTGWEYFTPTSRLSSYHCFCCCTEPFEFFSLPFVCCSFCCLSFGFLVADSNPLVLSSLSAVATFLATRDFRDILITSLKPPSFSSP